MSDKVKVQPKNESEKRLAELDQLAEAYNQNEIEQSGRLKRYFRLMKQGKGFRRVAFSNGDVWVNCWGDPDRLDAKLHINRMERLIVDVDQGD